MILDCDKKEFEKLDKHELNVMYACYMLKTMERQYGFKFCNFEINEETYERCEAMENYKFKLSKETMFEIFQELEVLGLIDNPTDIKSMMAKG